MVPLSLALASVLLFLSLWREMRPASGYVMPQPIYIAPPPPRPVYVTQPAPRPVYVTQPAPRPVYVQRRPAPRRKSSRTGIIIAVVVIIVIVLALLALSASSSASNGNVYEPVGYVQPGVYPPQGGYGHPTYY